MKNSNLNKGILSELTIIQTTLTDRGEYTCMATNAYGHDHSVVYLQVQEPPSFPTNLHVTELGSRTVTLTWSLDLPAPVLNRATHHYTQPITNYILQFKEAQDVWHDHNNQKMLPGDKTTAKITSLRPSTNYHFRLYAANQLGTSAPSDILHIQTDAEVPSGAPIMVTVEPLGPEQLLVTWRPPEREFWNGDLLGYKIGYQKIGGGNFIKDDAKFAKIQHQSYNFTRVGLSGGDGVNDFRLVNLDKYTQYLVTVQAFNSKGDGPPCEPVQARTLEDVPSTPNSCSCIALTSQNIQVSWQPPLKEHEHGVIQGYKVFYEPSSIEVGTSENLNVDYNENEVVRETKITSSLSTVLHGLQPFTNYSVQVLAFTRAGEGPTATTSCTTEETTPDPPERIKSVASSNSSVIISWLPPRRPNGIVTKYTIYIRILDKGQEIKVLKEVLPAQKHHFEAKDLNTRESYEAWVTASTRVGQGQSTPVIKLTPSNSVPAAIISFGQVLNVAWRVDIKLACLFVGKPVAKAEWKIGDSKR